MLRTHGAREPLSGWEGLLHIKSQKPPKPSVRLSFTSTLRGVHREPLPHLPSYDDLASQKITERFARNPEQPADEDVAERVFLISEERIQLRYHCRDDHITASKREFLRRSEVDNKGNKIVMTPDMCISFEVGLGAVAGPGGPGG